jgi:hypothetical protein
MNAKRRILNHIRSNLIAYVALFFALSGSAAYAAGSIYSKDIVDGQVFSVDVADENLTGRDVKDGGLIGVDIADNSLNSADVQNLTGSDVWDSSLTGADVYNGSLTGADVWNDSLTGVDVAEHTLSVPAMGCQSGKILGFARVKGKNGIPTSYTSNPTYIDITNNCAGGAVLVRRVEGWVGLYHVKFLGNPAALAVATPNADGEPPITNTENDNIITVAKEYSDAEGPYFRVEVRDVDDVCAGGACVQSGNFTMLLP